MIVAKDVESSLTLGIKRTSYKNLANILVLIGVLVIVLVVFGFLIGTFKVGSVSREVVKSSNTQYFSLFVEP